MSDDPFFLDDTRDLDHACTVISEEGCFADKAITDKMTFLSEKCGDADV